MKPLPLQYATRGIITNREGKILLVKHGSEKPWTLPGGRVQEGETFQEALIREVLGELDIHIELIGMVTIHREHYVHALPSPVRVQVIEYENDRGPQRKYEEFFLAHYISGTIAPDKSEIAEFTWFTLEEIQKMTSEIYPGIRDIITGSIN